MAEETFERSESGICCICSGLLQGAGSAACERCKTVYHPECWEYNLRRCAVYGCASGGEPRIPAALVGAAQGGGAGTLPHCAFHENNPRILDCRACGRAICTVCDFRVGNWHACPLCYEMTRVPDTFRRSVEILAGRPVPPRPRPEDRTLCAFHQSNIRAIHCASCRSPMCRLCDLLFDRVHLCPPCFQLAQEDGFTRIDRAGQ